MNEIDPGLMRQLTDLETRRAWAEMDAERVEDADDPAGARRRREEADRLGVEADRLAARYGLDLDEDNW